MQKHKTSVLIIGSGGAGLRCAIELFEQGQKDILLLGNRKVNDAHTIVALGGINASLSTMDPQDSPLVHAFDTYEEGQFVNSAVLVEKLTKHAPEAIDDLIKFGANFHKEEDGRLTQRFFGAHSYRRTCFSGDETGREIIRVLVNKVKELEVPFMEGVHIFKLINENGKIKGAVGIINNEIHMFEAENVVIATGGASNLFKRSSSRKDENYGDGIALAFNEGARIGDMELFQFHPTGLIWPEFMEGELVTEAVRAEGGILRNVHGERIMEKYDPEKLELSTRDVVARANYMEIQAGNGTKRGGVYLDVSNKSKEYILDRLPHMYKMLKEHNNIDITKEPMEVAPTAHYTMGGIYFDSNNYKTDIEGLYAIGECTMGVHGANRLGGNSLAEILVFGKLVGTQIASNKLAKIQLNSSDEKNIEMLVKTYSNDGELDPQEEIMGSRQNMWDNAGIIREEKLLRNGLEYLNLLKERVSKKGLKNSSSLRESIIIKNRLQNVIQLSEVTTLGAIERKESRGAHYREDYLEKKDVFVKNFLFKFNNKSTQMSEIKNDRPSAELLKMLSSNEKTKNYTHLE